MIPRKKQAHLIILLTIVLLFSCQKKKEFTSKITANEVQIEKTIEAADLYYKKKQLDSAFYLYNKARANCNPKQDAKNFVYCMYYMAEIQQSHSDFIGSTKTAVEIGRAFV